MQQPSVLTAAPDVPAVPEFHSNSMTQEQISWSEMARRVGPLIGPSILVAGGCGRQGASAGEDQRATVGRSGQAVRRGEQPERGMSEA
jgi:hypothetical protein